MDTVSDARPSVPAVSFLKDPSDKVFVKKIICLISQNQSLRRIRNSISAYVASCIKIGQP